MVLPSPTETPTLWHPLWIYLEWANKHLFEILCLYAKTAQKYVKPPYYNAPVTFQTTRIIVSHPVLLYIITSEFLASQSDFASKSIVFIAIQVQNTIFENKR